MTRMYLTMCWTELKFALTKRITHLCLLTNVANNYGKSLHTQTGERFDEAILNYIRTTKTFSKTTVNIRDRRRLDRKVKESFDYFFDRSNLGKSAKKMFPVSSISKLPDYIMEVGEERQQDNIHTLGKLSVCDFHCSKILEVPSSEQRHLGRFTSLKILDSWMHVLDHHYLVTDIQCYVNLIKHSTLEIISSSSSSVSSTILSKNMPELIHLAFVASLGKKNKFECHEILNEIASFCIKNPEVTYKSWNDFETAVMCSSFFRSGIKIESKDFLSQISSRLSEILEAYLISSEEDVGLNVSVVICLLKVLRQANFIEESVLSGVRKLIMDKDKGEDILRSLTVLSHFMSAFSSSPIKRQMTLDSSLASVLNRAEHLVNTTLRFEEEAVAVAAAHSEREPQYASGQKRMTKKNAGEVHPSVKSRLKDISRWLWSAATLGYQQIGVEAYDADLSRRFSTGEFSEEAPAAVEALLALAIMNHYPDLIVTKVLHSIQFRSTLKVRCHRRQKVRFALFLTLVKIERNDLWRQLSPHDMSQLEDIAPRSWFWNETQDWSSEHYDTRKEKFSNHCQMLNHCMDSLKEVFHFKEADFVNEDRRQRHSRDYLAKDFKSSLGESHNEEERRRAQIRRGCAVPYLFIPGIRVDFLDSGKSLFIEVLDTESFSQGFLQMKLRILSQLGNAVLYITPEEMKQCPDLGQFFKRNIALQFPD